MQSHLCICTYHDQSIEPVRAYAVATCLECSLSEQPATALFLPDGRHVHRSARQCGGMHLRAQSCHNVIAASTMANKGVASERGAARLAKGSAAAPAAAASPLYHHSAAAASGCARICQCARSFKLTCMVCLPLLSRALTMPNHKVLMSSSSTAAQSPPQQSPLPHQLCQHVPSVDLKCDVTPR